MTNENFTKLCDLKMCRLCGEENPCALRLFGEESSLTELAKKMCSYISEEFEDNGIYPRWICPGCYLDADSTERYFNIMRNGQIKLKQLYEQLCIGELPSSKESTESIPNEVLQPVIVKKRGRKRKEKHVLERPSSPEGKPLRCSTTVEQPTGVCFGKRLRRPPVRYNDTITQGEGLDALFAELNKSSRTTTAGICIKKENILETALIDSELIAQVRNADGTALGELVEVSPSECRNSTCFVCEICKETFHREAQFLSHVASHKNIEYECTQCEQSFKSKELFSQHQEAFNHCGLGIIEDSSDFTLMAQASLETSKDYESGGNNTTTIFEKNQTKDRNQHQIDNIDSNANLNQDDGDISPNSSNTNKDNGMDNGHQQSEFDCSKCGKIFYNKAAVRRHQVVHSDERPYKCALCPASFKTKFACDNHMSSHLSRKPFACDICLKRFVMKHSLEAHKRSHTGERPYKCSYCDKSFSQRSNTAQHERIHTCKRPFQCETCGAAFRTSSQLQHHSVMHLKEQFKNQNSITETMKVVNKELPEPVHEKPMVKKENSVSSLPSQSIPQIQPEVHRHRCKECGKTYLQSSNLTKHLRTHTGERPYKCNFCQRTFSDPSNLKKHRYLHIKKMTSNSSDEVIPNIDDSTMKELQTMITDQGLSIDTCSDPDPDEVHSLDDTSKSDNGSPAVELEYSGKSYNLDPEDSCSSLMPLPIESPKSLSSHLSSLALSKQLVSISYQDPTNPVTKKKTTFYVVN